MASASASSRTTKRRREEEKKTDPQADPLEEQLDRAEVAVQKARDATAYLHQQWRDHMFRLSFLVLLISFHMCRLPMSECIKNIKLANDLQDARITGFQAFLLILQDACCEIVGNLLMFCLAAFLAMKPPGTFSSPLYMLSTVFLPIQISLFYTKPEIGCTHILTTVPEEVQLRKFPVSVIYHSIVTACYFLMEYQSRAREQDVQAVMKLQTDLIKARASKKQK